MKGAREAWPGVLAVLALALTWGILATLSRGEAAAPNHPLSRFPMELGSAWTAKQLEVPERELEVLRATEVMLRSFSPVAHSQRAPRALKVAPAPQPVVLFVAYYQSQRTGATYHSPKHCLPGSGWEFTKLGRAALPGPYGGRVEVNEVVIRSGLESQVLFYWYQDRGRILSSEYTAKFYLIWDALTQNRSDGALVRVSVPVETDVAAARARALRFITDMWRPLSEVLAGQEPGVGRQVGSR